MTFWVFTKTRSLWGGTYGAYLPRIVLSGVRFSDRPGDTLDVAHVYLVPYDRKCN